MERIGQNGYAIVKDVQTMLLKEECAADMEHSYIDAAAQGAQPMLGMEECALDMGQRSNYVAKKDAQIAPNNEESVGGMGKSATQTMNLLHLNLNLTRLPLR